MIARSKLLIAALALAATALLAGCSSTASTPEQAVKAFYAALAAGDYAAAWEHVSDAQRSRLASDLESASTLNAADQDAFAKRLSVQFGTQISAAEVASLAPKDFFEKAMRSALERDGGKLRSQLSNSDVKPGSLAPSGDRADVAVSFLAPDAPKAGKSKTPSVTDQRIVHCVRESGGWRLLYTP